MYILENVQFRDLNINARVCIFSSLKVKELPGATFLCFACFTTIPKNGPKSAPKNALKDICSGNSVRYISCLLW